MPDEPRPPNRGPSIPAPQPPKLAYAAGARPCPPAPRLLARQVLYAFVLTFIAARVIVFLIMSGSIPDLYLHVRGAHVHHLNYGIFLLVGVGAYLLFARPAGRRLTVAAAVYGVGLGLTFDEFGMWLHLEDVYWQRASFDAIVVVTALLALIAYAPRPDRRLLRRWHHLLILAVALAVFTGLLLKSFNWAGKHIGPRLQRLEEQSPP